MNLIETFMERALIGNSQCSASRTCIFWGNLWNSAKAQNHLMNANCRIFKLILKLEFDLNILVCHRFVAVYICFVCSCRSTENIMNNNNNQKRRNIHSFFCVNSWALCEKPFTLVATVILAYGNWTLQMYVICFLLLIFKTLASKSNSLRLSNCV